VLGKKNSKIAKNVLNIMLKPLHGSYNANPNLAQPHITKG
jgi:hypothetical protein